MDPSLASEPARVPTWARDVDYALAQAMRESPLLASATPRDGATREELRRSFAAGNPKAPRWTYAGADGERSAALARALESLAEGLERRDPPGLASVYAARARELALEVLLAAAVGGRGFGSLARVRFRPQTDGEGSKLAAAWVSECAPPPTTDQVSDGEGPGSLLGRLREEIGKRRLGFRIVVSPGLAPLAATGDRTIWVAAGRAVAREDVERTVVHEIEGHCVPRARAALLCPGIFVLGTAHGVDEQEGFALTLEQRRGFLRGARRRELAARHRAVESMDAGGTFIDVVKTLVDRDGFELGRAIAAAERAFRGSDGEGAGLGRERVYLDSFVRVSAHLAENPADEAVIGAGQVALDAVAALRSFVR
ncbi:MAG TPA: tyrosine/phenylalanine carboxypeptidase domain-containing protein [Polyangiaceae bacterium]